MRTPGTLRVAIVGIVLLGADRLTSAWAGQTPDRVLKLSNGPVVLSCFYGEPGDVSFDSNKGAFKYSPRQPGGRASKITFRDALGAGTAIRIDYPDSSSDRIAIYESSPATSYSPLVFCQSSLHNPGKEVMVVDRVTPFSVQVSLDRAAKTLRILGCDGLTPGDTERASYSFLAVADPSSRSGVVAGWVSHRRGSGIVLSRPEKSFVLSRAEIGGLRIEGRSEYGKLRIEPGQSVEGETFAIGYFDDALRGLEAYADAVAAVNHVKLKPIPSGYCTWYSNPHGNAADEVHLAELAKFSKQHLVPFGFNVVQIDDGWQLARRDFTDYRHGNNARYPSGMKATADTIRGLGETAGLWLIPFGWDPTRPVFKDHQDWFVKRPDGKTPFEVRWAGTCFDMTHPGAREFLREVVSRTTRDWGYRYLKIDGLWTGMACEILYPQPTVRDDKLGEAVFHDPSKTNLEAYRDGLKLVREAAGPDTYIVGCNIAQNMRTLGGSFGLVDAMRVGRDIKASWDKILPCMEMGSRLYFFHNRVWHNDPDCLMLREPLTLDQARAWGTWIAISGQLNIVSEWLPGLPAERLDVVRRTMPNTGLCGRPLDLFSEESPRIWRLTDGTREIIGLFNWDPAKEQVIPVPLAKLGLKPGCVGFDYWENQFVGPVSDDAKLTLRPSSCRVLCLRPAAVHPQVVSTSRHVTQGIIDLKDEKWDSASRTLTGRSAVVGGDPYEMRIIAPATGTWKIASVEVSADDRAAGTEISIKENGPNARVTIKAGANRTVSWKVSY